MRFGILLYRYRRSTCCSGRMIKSGFGTAQTDNSILDGFRQFHHSYTHLMSWMGCALNVCLDQWPGGSGLSGGNQVMLHSGVIIQTIKVGNNEPPSCPSENIWISTYWWQNGCNIHLQQFHVNKIITKRIRLATCDFPNLSVAVSAKPIGSYWRH